MDNSSDALNNTGTGQLNPEAEAVLVKQRKRQPVAQQQYDASAVVRAVVDNYLKQHPMVNEFGLLGTVVRLDGDISTLKAEMAQRKRSHKRIHECLVRIAAGAIAALAAEEK